MRVLVGMTFVIIVLGVVACETAERPRLLIEITHPNNENPALYDGKLFAGVYELGSNEKTLLEDIEVTGELTEPFRAFSGLNLQQGERYEIVIQAELNDDERCRKQRAVGASVPFTYGASLERVPVFTYCADQSGGVAERLVEPRFLHTATYVSKPAPFGRVVIAGGMTVKDVSLEGLENAELQSSIEIFDPAKERFDKLQNEITQPRGLHSAVAVGDDVLLVGGYIRMNVAGSIVVVPAGDVDRVSGDEVEALGSLTVPRGMPGVVALDDGEVLVAGGSDERFFPIKTAELYDATVGKHLEMLPEMNHARSKPAAARAGNLVLLVGGIYFSGVQFYGEIFCPDGKCGCEGEPCFGKMNTFPKGGGRRNLAAGFVPCDGKGKGWAVYVLGGNNDSQAEGRAFKDIYCVDNTTLPTTGLALVGEMLEERQSHTVTLVRGRSEKRLFVAGGTANPLAGSGELIPAACRCPEKIAPGEIERVELNASRAGHTATLLPDGSVLLAGGLFNSETAERFVPDL